MKRKKWKGWLGLEGKMGTVVFASVSVRAGPMAAYFLAVVLF